MTRWELFKCLIGFHDWDGHTNECYPAPRCRRCLRWHRRKKVERKLR